MSNRLEQLLELWQPQKESLDWVLATVIETQGSAYRKAGAMMFINSLGQYYGLLSGGCLEADIMQKARKCWDSGCNQIVCYDMRDEDDLSWQLGIGCGGMVKILLQPITPDSNWLELDALKENLALRRLSYYCQVVHEEAPQNTIKFSTVTNQAPQNSHSPQVLTSKHTYQNNEFIHKIKPTPSIAIFGGGVDAQPVVKMAKVLGWRIILLDERVNYARPTHFKDADEIISTPLTELAEMAEMTESKAASFLGSIDAAVIMTHNVKLDGKALSLVQLSSCQFVGLLGPTHRTEKVLASAELTYQGLSKPLSNPVGLDIGGELPESIALSILSQIHAVLEAKTGNHLSDGIQKVVND